MRSFCLPLFYFWFLLATTAFSQATVLCQNEDFSLKMLFDANTKAKKIDFHTMNQFPSMEFSAHYNQEELVMDAHEIHGGKGQFQVKVLLIQHTKNLMAQVSFSPSYGKFWYSFESSCRLTDT